MSIVNRTLVAGALQYRRAITSHNSAAEPMFLERQGKRTADQSGAHNCDLAYGVHSGVWANS